MSKVDFLLHLPIAHRGLHKGLSAPENTLVAFQKAVDGHFPIELDCHMIKSGEVVVFHDDSFMRMCGIDKEVANCTLTEVRELFIKRTRERIPLLSEVLAAINGKVPILIELKCDQPTGKLEQAVLNILKGYKGKYAFQSFSPLTLRWLKKHAPEAPRGLLASDFKNDKTIARIPRIALKNLWLFPIAKPDFISYNFRALPNKRVEKLRNQGIPVLGWTIRKVSESREALKYCDNVICEEIL
ncbi:MAG: glycerophosphodiester phosphodiesterase [Candidatus Saccharibacteria bacterium]|nr:glycerophosphodiester phosphodiesterase [Candidatus Saccharibacteria bacterium]